MSEQVSEPTQAPPVIPAEPTGIPSTFEGLTLTAKRDAGLGLWLLGVEVGGVWWTVASRKTGGLDDDLQEKATPGFKEARAIRYARETGRTRTESGPAGP